MTSPRSITQRCSAQPESKTQGAHVHLLPGALLVVLLLLAGCALPIPVSGLRPEYPEVRAGFVEVDSLQPTLRWESFPRSQDHAEDKEGLLSRIRNVSYDLRIWRAENDYPVELIYARQALPEPVHKVEAPLEPSTNYFWTIRARFELDGHTRVTQWGVVATGRRLPLIPNPFYYRLKTPSE